MLEASRNRDLASWLTTLEEWPDGEVSAHPGYGALFAAPGDRVVCAQLKRRDGGILFPLILRPVGREVWAGGRAAVWDATSPYGYGGPFCWGCGLDEAQQFWSGLRSWAENEGVVSLFARLSLFPGQVAPFDGEVCVNAPNVVRSLDIAPAALWMEYEHKVRKNVKRAQREDVRVEVDLSGSRLDDFLPIYNETMDRRGAAPAYYFDRAFFERLAASLPGQFAYFHALHGDAVVSTELVLVATHHIYSFLGGTKAEAFGLRPNDLLKHEIILWGQSTGKRAFVLGGGYGGRDGIFRYKLSFAPGGEVPFRTGRIIFDPRAYSELVEARRSWEVGQGCEWRQRPGFFPAYRA